MKQKCVKRLVICVCMMMLAVSAVYFAVPLHAADTVKATVVDSQNRSFELEGFTYVVNGVGRPDIQKSSFTSRLSDAYYEAPFSVITQVLVNGSCESGWLPVEFTFTKGEKETGLILCYGTRLEGLYRSGKFIVPMREVRKIFFAAGK